MTPDAIDALLRDFRTWLTELTAEPPPACEAPPAIDLFALVGHFTALRHDVNLQTKAVRSALEQNAKLAEQVPPVGPDAESTRPLVKAVLDIADALTASHRQIERLKSALEPLLEDLASESLPEPPEFAAMTKPGPLARLFGAKPPETAAVQEWIDAAIAEDDRRASVAATAAEKLMQLADGAADGYAMSLRRVERVLPQFGLEAIPCVGLPFDPETMEVIEIVDGETGVVEEVRRGYLWNGSVFRFAQVKVAK